MRAEQYERYDSKTEKTCQTEKSCMKNRMIERNAKARVYFVVHLRVGKNVIQSIDSNYYTNNISVRYVFCKDHNIVSFSLFHNYKDCSAIFCSVVFGGIVGDGFRVGKAFVS